MSHATLSGSHPVLTELLRGIAETVAVRPGDTEARRAARHQAAAASVLAFLPRDPVEAMLAGQCVVFDHLVHDTARDMLRGLEGTARPRGRAQLIAMGGVFLRYMAELHRFQARPVETLAAQSQRDRSPEAASSAPSPARAETPGETPARTSPAPVAASPAKAPASASPSSTPIPRGAPSDASSPARSSMAVSAPAASAPVKAPPAAPAPATPLHARALRATPLHATPLHATPLHTTPLVHAAPPLHATPLVHAARASRNAAPGGA